MRFAAYAGVPLCTTDAANNTLLKSRPMNETKTKAVADIVMLLDVSGSMQACIDAVKANIGAFVSTLNSGDPNGGAPLKDWRMRVCGYRDQAVDAADWFVDQPFTRDVATIQAQLAAPSMQAKGGGDEPESLLDAIFLLAKAGVSGIQDAEDPTKWRARGSAHRAVVVFTDASFKMPMTLPEGSGGGIEDAIFAATEARLKLFIFAPHWEGYAALGGMDGAIIRHYTAESDAAVLAGLGKPGPEGVAAQKVAVESLQAEAAKSGSFGKLLETLAKTVSKEAAVEAC